MRSALLAAAAACVLCVAASPALAVLQIAISDGTNIFTCADGGACDFAGPTHNLLTLDNDVGAFHIVGTFSASLSGAVDKLTLSSLTITNTGLAEGHLTFVVGDTGFAAPVSSIHESASLTFNGDVGAGASNLKFWADPLDAQPAGLSLATPGPLLFNAPGTPLTDPDSFSGTHFNIDHIATPFSMTEGATLDMLGGSSITGFNEAMVTSSVPEMKTWAMLGAGFGLMGLMGLKRRKEARFAV